jgi:hypothetical protein
MPILVNFFYNNIFNWKNFNRAGKGLAKNVLILVFKINVLIAAGLITAGLKKSKVINNYFENSLIVLKNYVNNDLINTNLISAILLKNPAFRNNDV